ncbi:MAG: hypothetical protein ACK559_01145, partial [bacterium]
SWGRLARALRWARTWGGHCRDRRGRHYDPRAMPAAARTRSSARTHATRSGGISGARERGKAKRPSARRRAITPEDLLCLVGVSEPQMSPDGRSVLFVRKVVGARNSYEMSVWVADADGMR